MKTENVKKFIEIQKDHYTRLREILDRISYIVKEWNIEVMNYHNKNNNDIILNKLYIHGDVVSSWGVWIYGYDMHFVARMSDFSECQHGNPMNFPTKWLSDDCDLKKEIIIEVNKRGQVLLEEDKKSHRSSAYGMNYPWYFIYSYIILLETSPR